MAPKGPPTSVYQVEGKGLQCPICEHDRFWYRYTKLNTTGLSFFGLDWANRDALNLVCGQCSHMLWFHDPSQVQGRKGP